MELPEPAIKWLAQHSSSNTELACLSNVCERWREIVAAALLEVAAKPVDQDESSKFLLLPSLLRSLMRQELEDEQDVETYCLSWLHPEGMLSQQLAVDPMDESDVDIDDIKSLRGERPASPQHFAPSGHESYVGSEDEATKKSRKQGPLLAKLRRNELSGSNLVYCLYQWNSYKEATDILRPFGYSPTFVRNLIEFARASADLMTIEDSTQTYSTHAVRGATFARPEGFCLCWDKPVKGDTSSMLRQEELNRLARKKRRRRREVQREVLPRIVSSNPMKGAKVGGRQPAVQFLNVDLNHAVRLFTPPFKPGPVSVPITIFCVGIATEDGCFLSGLRSRFEFGHLYPASAVESAIERSPICVCTDFEGHQSIDKDPSYNSDDSSYDGSMDAGGSCDPGVKCPCAFSGLGTGTDDEDTDKIGHICRGRRGPGAWHCYVAVVDGLSSSVRIDGIPEPLRCTTPNISKSKAFLDGLTIGADHTFDMSLCFGQGSDGEGEGAISELAVFKGRLDTTDIKVMESYLMKKHGIPSPIQSGVDLHEEDDFARLAHAMLTHAPHHKVFANGAKRVPLRCMTKHRTVAWKQTNPVTGEAIRVSRIGTKTTESCSEW